MPELSSKWNILIMLKSFYNFWYQFFSIKDILRRIPYAIMKNNTRFMFNYDSTFMETKALNFSSSNISYVSDNLKFIWFFSENVLCELDKVQISVIFQYHKLNRIISFYQVSYTWNQFASRCISQCTFDDISTTFLIWTISKENCQYPAKYQIPISHFWATRTFKVNIDKYLSSMLPQWINDKLQTHFKITNKQNNEIIIITQFFFQ